MVETGFVWVCNECGKGNFTDAIHEDDLEWLACDSCGGYDFHKEQKQDTRNVELTSGAAAESETKK